MPKYLKTIFIAAGILAFFIFLPKLLGLTAPFLLAFFFAAASQRLIRTLERKLKINRGVWAAVLIGFVMVIFVGGFAALILETFKQIKSLILSLPSLTDTLRGTLGSLTEKYDDLLTRISPELSEYSDEFSARIRDYIQRAAATVTDNALGAASGFARSLPSVILFIAVFLISSFFMAKDYRLIINFLKDALPDAVLKKLSYLKATVFDTFFSYIKAQSILMCITFAIVSVYLWILGVSYPILIGAAVGIVDALPFFGAGTALLPWAVTEFALGKTSLAVALAVLWLVCFLTRQILEPKILSAQIGVHPLLTIFSVYAGLKIFGVFGVLIGPIAAVLAVNLYSARKNSADLTR